MFIIKKKKIKTKLNNNENELNIAVALQMVATLEYFCAHAMQQIALHAHKNIAIISFKMKSIRMCHNNKVFFRLDYSREKKMKADEFRSSSMVNGT